MAAEANKVPEAQNPRTPESSGAYKPTPAELLVEQYKLLEERRKYFGSQFMQTIGGVGAMFSLLVGLLGGSRDSQVLLRSALFVGGIAFVLLAYLGYRLGNRQDDCEKVMSEIESSLQKIGYTMVAEMPAGAKNIGARKVIVGFLGLLGAALIVIGFRGW